MNRIVLLATILWIACGLRIGYDVFHPGATPTPIVKPLRELPLDVVGEGWEGEDVRLSEDVEERAGVDDYVKRIYSRSNARFSFYVGYVTGFKVGAVHNPDVCNPGSGYELVEKKIVTIPTPELDAEVRFNEYKWRDPVGGRLVFTLSTFCYNGNFEPSEIVLRANGWRAKYFSVITMQGGFIGTEDRTREEYYEIIRKSVPVILEHFPD